jgi:hypothetical protein
MKWYKHLAKSLTNPFIRALMYEFGADAYLVFFGTLEIYADNFMPSELWQLCVKTRFLRDQLLLSTSKLQNILTKISQNPDIENKWEVKFKNDEVIIFIPKFKKIVDNYTKDNNPKTCKLLASDQQETFQAIRIKNKDIRIKKNTKGIFQIPSLQEISVYCQQRKNQINPQLFIDHYIANGWMVGKNKMKDWKAAIRTWEKNDFGGNYGTKTIGTNSYRKNNNDRELDPEVSRKLDEYATEYYTKKSQANSQDTKKTGADS